MPDIKAIPRSKTISKTALPGLKVGDMVQTQRPDWIQPKGSFEHIIVPSGQVGRVKRIFDFGPKQRLSARFLIDVKFYGKPLCNFYSTELLKVRV